ncbi:MAG: hypothetical protein ACMXYG_05830 [Candidatus Woesearchaeota archaeon]
MEEETYRFERVLYFFAIVLVITVIFTGLNFFGLITPEKWGREYCIPDNHFECNALEVLPNQIRFQLTNNDIEITSINIRSANSACQVRQIGLIRTTQPISVNLDCSLTATKGSTYTDTITMQVMEQNRIQPRTVTVDIKSIVE